MRPPPRPGTGPRAVDAKHAVADEAPAVADEHADLAERLRQRHRGRQDRGTGLPAADDLEQPHHVGRAEKVVADHLLRPRGRRGDLVDVQRRGVGGQNGIGPGDLVDLGEDLLLQLHLLKDRLDHDVGFGEPLVGQGRLDHRQALGHLLVRQPALPDAGLIVLADGCQSAVEGRLVDFLEQDRDARVGVGHRDAAPHRPRADDGRPLDGQGRGLPGEAGDLGHFRSPKKTWINAFDWSENRHSRNSSASLLQALGKGQRGRRGDGLDGLQRRQQVGGAALDPCRALSPAPRRWPPDREASP